MASERFDFTYNTTSMPDEFHQAVVRRGSYDTFSNSSHGSSCEFDTPSSSSDQPVAQVQPLESSILQQQYEYRPQAEFLSATTRNSYRGLIGRRGVSTKVQAAPQLYPPEPRLPVPVQMQPSSSMFSEKCHPRADHSVTSLADLFQGQWDPTFASYLQNLTPAGFQRSTSVTVSNYTIEQILAEGMKNGSDKAEREINNVLRQVPIMERESLRKMLVQRAQALIRKRRLLPLCAFCRNNGEAQHLFMSHVLKDAYGRVQCPILRAYTCPRCGANGDNAHTISYCPVAKEEQTRRRHMSGSSVTTDHLIDMFSSGCFI